MAVLEPKLAILDETDSGLDIDALRIVADGVNTLRAPGQRDDRRDALPAAAQLHRARLRARAGDGRIVKSGGKELALELEAGLRVARGGGREPRRDRGVRAGVRGARPAPRTAEAPEWLEPLRRAAIERFARTGFPDAAGRGLALHAGRADRAGELRRPRRRRGAVTRRAARAVRLRHADWHHARLRERRVQRGAELRRASCRAGVRVASLAEALRADGALLESASRPGTRRSRAAPFTALNTAFLRDGGVVHVAGRTSTLARPIHLLFVTTRGGRRHGRASAQPDRGRARRPGVGDRELRDARAGAALLDQRRSPRWSSAPGAWVEHTRIQRESERALSRRAHPRGPGSATATIARSRSRWAGRWRGTTCTSGSTTRTSRR